MLDTVLNLINTRMQYKRGIANGLPGLVAILLFIGFFVFFEPIYKVLDFIGLITLLDKMGIITPDPSITLWRLIGVVCAVTVMLWIAIFLLGLMFSFIPFVGTLGVYVMFALLYPIYSIINLFVGSHTSKVMKRAYEDYLFKNGRKVEYEEILEKNNILPYKRAFFYIGVTKDKKYYLIMPRPYALSTYSHKGRRFTIDHHVQNGVVSFYFQLAKDKTQPIENVPIQEIEYYIENRSQDFVKFYDHFVRFNGIEYTNYMYDTNNKYEQEKDRLLKELNRANNPKHEQYPKLALKLKAELKRFVLYKENGWEAIK